MPLDDRGGNMAKVVNCECDVEEHVRQQHPEMAGQMSREQVLAMAEEV
jgi:uncharacterized protein